MGYNPTWTNGAWRDNTNQYINTSGDTTVTITNDNIKKDDLFIIFYINVQGLTKTQSAMRLEQISSIYEMDNVKNFNITKIVLPVLNDQNTKIEIINPKITNTDIIESFKKIVDVIDNDKLNDIIEKLKNK